jgi:undecaprenyl-phosphate 4-deoxy-4-formamido-L-arabinose transferase
VLAIESALANLNGGYEIVLVNDNSPDASWRRIEELSVAHPSIVGVDLRKNFGQDAAILTGLSVARGRCVAIMDDDLQHDPKDLPRLIEALDRENADVVYANFSAKKRQALWKNMGSAFNDLVARWVIEKPKGIYLSPYKVVRGSVARAICSYEGRRAYVDGLLFLVTSKITQIPAEHHDRVAGTSNYTFWKSVRVWSHLAFSFSTAPLRLVTALGLISAIAGIVLAAIVVAYRALRPQDFPVEAVGWASLMVAVLMIGGAQMFFFGVLGEYVGRTYLTASRTPQTSIAKIIGQTSPSIRAHAEGHSLTWNNDDV